MTDPQDLDPTEPIQGSPSADDALRDIGDVLDIDPTLAAEVSRFASSLKSTSPGSTDRSLSDTASLGTDTHDRTPTNASASVSVGKAAARFGDYEILDAIAQGGMGVVYRARHVKLNRIVALKRIRSAEFANAEQVRRFYAEAEAAAKLDHPGIVSVYDVGEVDGEHYYSMAYVDGESLADRVKRDGPLRPKDAARFIHESAIAVQKAHDAGIIHRDIKPQNLLLDGEGKVRVTDFGLAKLQESNNELTREGQVLGTPAYMPPEQASGRLAEVGVLADVYSLGATLYFLLTGRPPFQASTLTETLRQVVENEPASPRKLDPSVPRDLETICLKSLSKEPSRRYANAQELAEDLGRWLAGEPIQARPVGNVEKAWKWCKRKPLVAGLTASIVLTVIIGSLLFWERTKATEASGLVDALATAEPEQVPGIIEDLDRLSWWATPLLQQQLAREGDSPDAKRTRLHARLALAKETPNLADTLVDDLLSADLNQVANIRNAMGRSPDSQVERLWAVFRATAGDEKPTMNQRFRAGLALVGLDTDNKKWKTSDHNFLVEQLLATNPVFQPLLWDLLRPRRQTLIENIEVAFKDSERSDSERLGAANALADLAAADIAKLANLLSYATQQQFAVIYPLVAANPTSSIVEDLASRASTLPPDALGSVERIAFGQQRANAAISLLGLGDRDKVLSVFEYTDDPEALTQFIFRYRERGVGAEPLLELLDEVTRRASEGASLEITSDAFRLSARARYALLLALGEYQLEEIPETRREPLLEQLADWYAKDPSAGVHGASGWLLRQWEQTEVATRIDQTPVPYSPEREWFTLAITVTPTQPPQPSGDATEEADESDAAAADDQDETDRDENTNSKDETSDAVAGRPVEEAVAERAPTRTFYYTFIVLQADQHIIGSVVDEPDREKDEGRHSVELTRTFAILDRELTFEELIAFDPQYAGFMSQTGASPNDAGFGPSWYDAVAFSRWLGQQMALPENQQAYASPDSLGEGEYPREPNPSANWAPRDWPVNLDRRGFRLPTEAEWEVAARAGARTAYGYGSEVRMLERFGWFVGNSSKMVHPPKERRPTGNGLFDMHGNLVEWSHDWHTFDFASAPLTNPLGPSKGLNRVLRGGSWDLDAAYCRAAFRFNLDPWRRSLNNGFRLALSPSGGTSSAEQGVGAEPAGAGTEGASEEQKPEKP